MHKLASLLGMLLKTDIGISPSNLPRMKSPVARAVTFALLIIVVLPSYGMFAYACYSLISGAIIINQPGFVFAALMIGASIGMFVASTAYIFTTFFNSDDNSMLISMPIKPSIIAVAKLIRVLVSQYLFIALLIGPSLIAYPMLKAVSPLYYIYCIAALLLCPIVPLSIAAILCIVIVRVFAIRVSSDWLQGIATALSIAFTVGINILMRKGTSSMQGLSSAQVMALLYSNSHIVVEAISKSYPPALFASRALTEHASFAGFANLCAYSAVCAASFALAALSSSLFYLKAAISGKGIDPPKAKRAEFSAKAFTKSRPKALSIALYDLKTLIRTPTFAFNAFGQVFILPLLFAYILSIDARGAAIDLSAVIGKIPDIAILYASLGICYLLTISSPSSTTFSREGKAIWISRTTPVEASEQLIGRLIAPFALIASSCLLVFIALTAYFGFGALASLLAVVYAFMASMPVALFGAVIDISRPRTEWESPAEAVKGMNTLIQSFVCIAYIGLNCIMLFFLDKAGASSFVLYLELAMVHIASSALLVWIFLVKYSKWIVERK